MKHTKARRLGIFSRSRKTKPLTPAEQLFMFCQMILGLGLVLWAGYAVLSGFIAPWLG